MRNGEREEGRGRKRRREAWSADMERRQSGVAPERRRSSGQKKRKRREEGRVLYTGVNLWRWIVATSEVGERRSGGGEAAPYLISCLFELHNIDRHLMRWHGIVCTVNILRKCGREEEVDWMDTAFTSFHITGFVRFYLFHNFLLFIYFFVINFTYLLMIMMMIVYNLNSSA